MPLVQLAPRQRLQLRDALFGAFIWPRMSDLLLSINKQPRQYEISDILTNMMAVVVAAEGESWIHELVDQAHLMRPADVDILAFQRDLAIIQPTPVADPFEACCLVGSNVMVNRGGLRSALRELSTASGKRILVVKDETPAPPGQSKPTGKSHSTQFISYLKAVKDFRFINVDLERTNLAIGTGQMIQPSDLASRLSTLLGYADILPNLPTDAQWSRWNLQFCDSFEARARNDTASKCWIVIDQFNIVLLPQPTLDLVKELSSRINMSLDHFRLILIGYGDTFPMAVRGTIEVEMVKPVDQIDQNELIQFFARAYAERKLNATKNDIAQAVTGVITGKSLGDFSMRVGAELNKPLPRV